MSSLNLLIFKAISILFEESSRQFESAASEGGREGERKQEEEEQGRCRALGRRGPRKVTGCSAGELHEGCPTTVNVTRTVTWLHTCRTALISSRNFPPEMASSQFLRAKMRREEEKKGLRQRSGPFVRSVNQPIRQSVSMMHREHRVRLKPY